ncbi:baseplate J/gp47 family protein [Clostridium tyrobutyricum]|uniref:baseplate J/gp47 family protein n=1 Tax=Clostridium tyrobutyricum TaxID=1519 RepID=UPI0020CC2467|nr:baseplate J/gp47 family protein [Clostridium tyrobutyricum]
MYSDSNSSDDIRNRMLDDVPSDIDKSEGSFIYDALSPASKEIGQTYNIADDILDRTSPFTAAGTDLENITNAVGITRKQGEKATTDILIEGVPDTVVLSGTLVQTEEGLEYETLNDIVLTDGQATVAVQARDVGSNYNVPANAINQLPVQISGVTSITNPESVNNGYDIEDDDSLRGRYFERMQTPATSGNKYQYMSWAKEVTGVGDAKSFPLWNGPGTVKIVIINSNKRAADTELVQKVKDYIDPQPERNGEGQAPIGAALTVVSAIEKAINITAKVILANGYTIQQVQDNFTEVVGKYLSDIAFNSTYVSYAKIGSLLLSTAGIVDYDNLTLNTGTANVALQDEEIPVPGTISLGV